MKSRNRALFVFSFVAAAALAAGGYFAWRHRVPMPERVEAHLKTWHDGPRRAAEVLIERYGPPDSIAPVLATWRGRTPWKWIAVHGDSPDSYLEHAVGYQAPPAAIDALAAFGHGIRFNPDNDELSARSGSETLNYLALNLADEIAAGKRSPLEASDVYVRTARRAASGKSSPYLESLRFEPYQPPPEPPSGLDIGY
ncbi:MAG: hypothetical protein NDJ72_10240 [Elusimicrobia bacterium]|nr:hypothetical protein [Elusimicrobiota bacterium]